MVERWWDRLAERARALGPAARRRLIDEGGLRSVLVLVVAMAGGARAQGLVEAAAPVAAMALGVAALLLPAPPATGWGRARSFVVARLSEPGTCRSLALLVLGLGQGWHAGDLVDHAEAVGLVVIGAVSAMQPAKGA